MTLRVERTPSSPLCRTTSQLFLSHENDKTLADIDKRLEELQTELLKLANAITEYDEQLVPRLFEKLTVHEDKVTVEFKSGANIYIEG